MSHQRAFGFAMIVTILVAIGLVAFASLDTSPGTAGTNPAPVTVSTDPGAAQAAGGIYLNEAPFDDPQQAWSDEDEGYDEDEFEDEEDEDEEHDDDD